MKKKRLFAFTALLMIVCLFFSFAASASSSMRDENTVFEAFCNEQFVETVESDYLTLHFLVKNWRELGYEKPELTLGTVSYETDEEALSENQDILDELLTFDRDLLSTANKGAYDSLKAYLECMAVLDAHPEFDEMFNPYSGSLSDIITNFTEFTFFCEEDVQDYLVLLEDVDRLLFDMMDFTEQQAADGFFMTDASLDEALDEMADFVAKGKHNPLIEIFNGRVESLGLSSSAVKEYEKRNKDIVEKEIYSAYKQCMSRLDDLRGSRAYEGGLATMPGGAEYYEALVKYRTGTDIAAEKLFDMLEKSISSAIAVYQSSIPSDFELTDFPEFGSPEAVLEHHTEHMYGFPQGPDVTYEVSYLDPSVATPSISAYYLNAPVDDLYYNVIRVNGSNVSDDSELYTTLAHEGFPGHLYQTTYWLARPDFVPLTYMLGNLGYGEGWAMYAENMMLRKGDIDPVLATFIEVNEYYSYLLSAQMDIGIHALGWDTEDLWDFLDPSHFFYTLEDAEDEFNYFVSMPGALLSYGVGDCMFMTLRARVQMSLGSMFDEEEFHKVILDNGERPFASLEEDLVDYVHGLGYEYNSTAVAYSIERGMVPHPTEYAGDPHIPGGIDLLPEWFETFSEIYVSALVPAVRAITFILCCLDHKKMRKEREAMERAAREQAQNEMIAQLTDNDLWHTYYGEK